MRTTSSAVAEGYGGTSKQGFFVFGEDVPASLHYAAARKKRLRLLSEERLSPRSFFVKTAEDKEVKPSVFALTGYAVTSAASFAIFLTKKWRREWDLTRRAKPDEEPERSEGNPEPKIPLFLTKKRITK